MTKHLALASLAVCSLVAGAAADSVHDNYRYTSATSIELTSPSRLTLQSTENGTLTATSQGAEVKFVFSSNGQTCRLAGRIAGHAIRFYGNQSCSFGDASMRFTASLTAGSATVDDDGSLDLEIVWAISGTSGGQKLAGTATERTSATPL